MPKPFLDKTDRTAGQDKCLCQMVRDPLFWRHIHLSLMDLIRDGTIAATSSSHAEKGRAA